MLRRRPTRASLTREDKWYTAVVLFAVLMLASAALACDAILPHSRAFLGAGAIAEAPWLFAVVVVCAWVLILAGEHKLPRWVEMPALGGAIIASAIIALGWLGLMVGYIG